MGARFYSGSVGAEVLDACKTPRTMAQLETTIHGEGRQVRFAVYNLRKRGLLDNLNAGTTKPGLFVAKDATHEVKPHQPPSFDAPQRAWGAAS